MAIASGKDEAQRTAASKAAMVQDAVNMIAIVGCFHQQLLAMKEAGTYGDNLNNHPVTIAFINKLSTLCRTSLDREMKAFDALDQIIAGDDVEYEVIPI